MVKFDKSATDVLENTVEQGASMMSVYPNSRAETAAITLSISEQSSAFLRLYSIAGQLLAEHDLSRQTGEFTTSLSLLSFDIGLYF